MASTIDYNAAYAKADQAIKKQYETAKNTVATAPNATAEQYAGINDKVRKRRNLYAIGNNESSNVGQDSGYVNTNRLRSEAALSADIAANIKQQAEADAERDINAQLLGYQADIAANQYLANSALNKADAIEQQAQYDASMDMARQEAQAAQQQYAAEMAYNKAMAELELFGMITTQEAANTLGLPVGTTSLEWQTYLAKRGGRGPGKEDYEDYVPPPGNAGVVPGGLNTSGYRQSQLMHTSTGKSQGVVPGALATDKYYRKNTKY